MKIQIPEIDCWKSFDLDNVAFLWTGATDFGQDGYWTWSQSKKPIEVRSSDLEMTIAIWKWSNYCNFMFDQLQFGIATTSADSFCWFVPFCVLVQLREFFFREKLNYINSSSDSCWVKPISTFKVEKIETKLNGSIHSLTFPILDILNLKWF